MVDGICPFTNWKPVIPHTANANELVGFCDHTAGGYYGTLADQGFWNAAGYSVHFCIAEDGRGTQLVNIFDSAYGQGRDSRPPDASHPNGYSVGPDSPGITWLPFSAMNKRNPNSYLISTEHEDKTVVNKSWTEAMYQTDLSIKKWCIEEAKRIKNKDLLRFGIDSLAGHYMFDPVNRVNCPGRGWPRGRLYQDLQWQPNQPENEMKAFNATAAYFTNRAYAASSEYYVMQMQDDFGLPEAPVDVEVACEIGDGGEVEWYDGLSTTLQHRVTKYAVFWIRMAGARERDEFGNPDRGKTALFRTVKDTVFKSVKCIGYN